jgi:hypothetical protein
MAKTLVTVACQRNAVRMATPCTMPKDEYVKALKIKKIIT